MMAVPVNTSASLQLGTPVVLFLAEDNPQLSFRSGFAAYDTTPNPDQLLMMEYVGRSDGPSAKLIFAENWYESYRKSGN